MPTAREIKDVVCLKVPGRWHDDAVKHAAGEDTPQFMDELINIARNTIMAQYVGNPKIMSLVNITTEWLITSDLAEIEDFQPGDGCPACIAGNDQARAFLREHPDRYVALGNLVYTEIWRD